MRRLILSLIVMLSSSFSVWADDWVCMNIQKIPEDLTASIYERKGNEYLVYIPINTREITILPSKGDNVIIDLPVTESKVTYLIEMSQGETSLDGKQLNYNAMSVQELTALANMWFTKAALQGEAYSMCEVGKYYFGGYGIPKDLKKAYDWFSKSAEKNAQKFLHYVQKAVAKGNAIAQNLMGCCYLDGTGVTPSRNEAMVWLQKAVDNNVEEAKEVLQKIQ